MTVYIFNGYFPDLTGFGLRCKKSLDALSSTEDMVIYCRKKDGKEPSVYAVGNKEIPIYRFASKIPLIENPSRYLAGLYEFYRNAVLFFGFSFGLASLLLKLRKEKNLKLYVVSSPLTIPFFSYCIGKIFGAKPYLLEFHDLEPELGIHIKNLKQNSLVVRIEYLLEKFLTQQFAKTIVTSDIQSEVLTKRTGVSPEKICTIPNTVGEKATNTQSKDAVYTTYGLSRKDFVLGYISTLSYGYTYQGLLKIIHNFSHFTKDIPNLKLLIAGGGASLQMLRTEVAKKRLEHSVIFTGDSCDLPAVVSSFNAGIIPWEKDGMTQTLLPTKLFEYMAAKKIVIAPDFGEFSRLIKNGKNGYLYHNLADVIAILLQLTKDREMQKIVGQNGYDLYKKHYTIPVIAKKLVSFYTV